MTKPVNGFVEVLKLTQANLQTRGERGNGSQNKSPAITFLWKKMEVDRAFKKRGEITKRIDGKSSACGLRSG